MTVAERRHPSPIDRLQAYLRWSTRQGSAVVLAPPFTLFLHQGDAVAEDDCAIPDEPAGDPAALAALLAAFAAHGRRPRVTFLAEFAPGLASALRAAGFVEEARTQLLACTRDTLRTAPDVLGLTMVTLSAESALAEVREGLDANERGFNPRAVPPTDAEAEAFRRGLVENRAFTARLDGQPAGAGMFNPPHAGVAELVGITTLEPFRHRGVAAYLTAYAARTAFDLGVELVYLSTDNAVARRVYDRLGFRPYAVRLTYGYAESSERNRDTR